MEFTQLVGRHFLSGVDRRMEDTPLGRVHALVFCLDDVVYACCEDPTDGYRSAMEELQIRRNTSLSNTFYPIQVLATTEEGHILTLWDCVTHLLVLRVGTDFWYDYYPLYVAEFWPENMCLNVSGREEATHS